MLKGYKTYIAGGTTLISAVAAYLVGDIDLFQAVQLIVPAVLSMTVRNAIG